MSNACSDAIKVYSCLQKPDGTWTACMPDGTFDDGLKSGEMASNWTCESNGQYKVWAVKLSAFAAGTCPWPKP